MNIIRKVKYHLSAMEDSLQGFDTGGVWTDDYVKELAGYRTDDYNKLYTKPLSDRSNQYLLDCATVLDVGCGWMPYQPDFRYTGLDVSPSMLERAKQLHPDTKFVLSNAYLLPFPDKSFEGVRSSGMLRHMKEWRPALKEMVRVGSKKLAFSHLIGGVNKRCGKYQWCTTLKDVIDLLPDCPSVYVVKQWKDFSSVLFMVRL